MKQKFLICALSGAFLKPVYWNGDTTQPAIFENQDAVNKYLATTNVTPTVVVPIYVKD